MMRMPMFQFRSPQSIGEAALILDSEGQNAAVLAGGTDLLPKMKRRQQSPSTLVSLQNVPGLRETQFHNSLSVLGTCLTLAEIAAERRFPQTFAALRQAAAQVATPHIRNRATLGGNICLDTRCNYYDQTFEWRKSIGFCMKKDGVICWVAPGSRTCMAVSSTDTAPALIALGARVRLVSHSGEREVLLSDLYQTDGIHYLTRRANEIVTEVLLDSSPGWRSTYWKLRRRGSFDFPVLSVAAAVKLSPEGTVENARIVMGSAASRPLMAVDAIKALTGRPLNREAIEESALLASRIAKPLDNTDFDMTWRKKVAAEFVTSALRELAGEDMRARRASLMNYDFSDAYAGYKSSDR